jgi:predicted AAA+ superfamily ATPase
MIKRGVFPETGLKKRLMDALYASSDVETVYKGLKTQEPVINKKWASYDRDDVKDYLSTGSVPFALHGGDQASIFLAIDRIIDKLIQKDILELGNFKIETLKQIKPLLLYLAQGSIVSVSKVGGIFGLNKNTLQDVLDVLVKAEILIKVPPFKADNKASKYLFMCPALRNALLDISGLQATNETRRGEALEDVVALHLYREFVAGGYGKISYDAEAGGADFILDLRIGKRIVIEIGSGDKTTGQARQTLEKTKGDYGIVYNSDPLELYADSRIIKVPHDFFFQM